MAAREPSSECTLWHIDLGRYNFETFTVLLARHDDPAMMAVTAAHEFTHHVLTSGSTYGLLLQRIKSQTDKTDEWRYRRLLNQLAAACRDTQEMAATYNSIAMYDRQHLLRMLPEEYQAAYRRGAALAEREFATPLLRTHYTLAIARCAMMTPQVNELSVRVEDADEGVKISDWPDGTVVMDLLHGRRADLPDNYSPDRRLSVIEEQLSALPIHTVAKNLMQHNYPGLEPTLTSETYEELVQAKGGDYAAALDALGNLTQALMFVLCRLLDRCVPGLSDDYSWFRAQLFTTIGLRETRYPGFGSDEILLIEKMAAQNVRVNEGAAPRLRTVDHDPRELIRIVQHSVGENGALYLYPRWPDNAAGRRVLLVNPKRHRDTVECFSLNDTDTTVISQWTIRRPWVTIIDWRHLRRLTKDSPVPEQFFLAIGRRCFAYIAGKPFDYLIPYLDGRQKIKWTVFDYSDYANGIRPEHHLQVVLYAFNGYPHWLFHLSNPVLTAAISELTRALSDPDRLAYVPIARNTREFPEDEVQRLCEHPVLRYFYVLGREPG